MSSTSTTLVRFVTPQMNPESGYPSGLFIAAWDVRHSPSTCEFDREQLRDLLVWFGAHLREPERFWRSSSKAANERNWRGLSWFKDTASEHIANMHVMARILFDYGYPSTVIHTTKPGFVVYEDDVQLVAEPFADTPLC